MVKKNQDIRNAIKEAGLFHYQVAEQLGIHEATFTVALRKPATPDFRAKVFKAIEDLQAVQV